ncbi:hypothetical protein FACS1894204_09510 [Synergistales bacterium]|nr:hypothetical protein FACS1894204_09510 [Synergistales bacterium]
MAMITIDGQSLTVEAQPGKTLLESLRLAKVAIESPCGGKGICGKCKVHLMKGKLSDVSAGEGSLLSASELKSNYRLACFAVPDGDVTIRMPREEREHEILSDGRLPDFTFEPSVRKKFVTIQKPTLTENLSPFEEIFARIAQVPELDFRVLHGLTLSKESDYTLVYDETRIIGVEAGDTTDKLYGIALDIGTTTVVASLVNLSNGTEIAVQSVINPQKQYGLDVLSRISYVQEHGEKGLLELQKSITEAFSEMVDKLCAESEVDRRHIYQVSVAANATMLHLLLGVNPASMGISPFAPMFTKSKKVWATDIGIELAPGAVILCLPSVSSYIGADIVAGVYVSGMADKEKKERVLFIDIGTNGEIVLSDGDRLVSCSCAAGPALEGMNILCGMRAAKGAIEDVVLKPDGTVAELKVIGSVPPVGICGSGILGAIREALKAGFVQHNGYMLRKDEFAPDDPRSAMCCLHNGKTAIRLYKDDQNDVIITQADIRQVQLAKGAILSGFRALLQNAGLEMNDLDKVLIAGQFGAHLPIESIVGCGIIPDALSDRIEYLGNSAKTGAYISLLSLSSLEEMTRLRKRIEYMELSVSPNYERLFLKCIDFGA